MDTRRTAMLERQRLGKESKAGAANLLGIEEEEEEATTEKRRRAGPKQRWWTVLEKGLK